MFYCYPLITFSIFNTRTKFTKEKRKNKIHITRKVGIVPHSLIFNGILRKGAAFTAAFIPVSSPFLGYHQLAYSSSTS